MYVMPIVENMSMLYYHESVLEPRERDWRGAGRCAFEFDRIPGDHLDAARGRPHESWRSCRRRFSAGFRSRRARFCLFVNNGQRSLERSSR